MRLRSEMLKRLLAGGLSLAMAVSMCPSTVFAAEENTEVEEVVEISAESEEETVEVTSSEDTDETSTVEETETQEETVVLEDNTSEEMESEDITTLDTEENSDIEISDTEQSDGVYVLMNIPYSVFYGVDNATVADVDAVSSATNKTGNYGFAGGAYHSGTTAEASTAEDGTVSYTAVGGANGSQVQGAIWAVKADDIEAVKALGGEEVTDDSKLTTATLGRGQASTTDLVGYETLTEKKAYSYYVLSAAPSNYLTLNADGSFTANVSAEAKTATTSVTYGSNWGDVQINLSGDDTEAISTTNVLVDAVEITAEDASGNTNVVGLYHLDQIWQNVELAWKVASTAGLDGKTIKNIRYYCMVKDADTSDATAPAYENYVYDYAVDQAIPTVYTQTVGASFDDANTISLSNLPSDASNVKAKVYYTTGSGRTATKTYLTPSVVDPSDDDIDPINVDVVGGKITFTAGSVTNNAGTTVEYGTAIAGTSYTVELSSDNYILSKTSAVAKEAQTLTVAASSYSKTYGDAAFNLNATATNTITYSSSNANVAAVDAKGNVTIKGVGSATITVTAAASDELYAASKTVTVNVAKQNQTITVASTFNKTFGNKAFNLGAKADGTLSYSSNNTKVATVDAKGNVTIKGAGTAVITVKAAATATKNAASATVTVKVAKASQTVTVKSISKSYKKNTIKKKAQAFTMGAKAKTKLTYAITKYGSKKAKKYLSINKSTGKVTAKKGTPKGTYKVIVKSTAAATTNYKAAAKSVYVTVKVK